MTAETTTTQDKQITVAVPEDRVAEFYAFYGRFLAGPGGRRGRGRRHGHGHGEHRCDPRHHHPHPAEHGHAHAGDEAPPA